MTKGSERFDFQLGGVFLLVLIPLPTPKEGKIKGKPQVSKNMGRASSETRSLSGSECSSHGQQRMALLGSAVPFLLSVPHRPPQYCIHGTNGIGPYVQRPARATFFVTDISAQPARDSGQALLSIPATAPGHLPLMKYVGDKSAVPALLQLCRFSIKLQLSWFAFVVVLFLR